MRRQKGVRRKLDNVALAFPAATGKADSRVFRIYCRLNEQVDGKLLRASLKAAVRKYPLFQSVLKRGSFWYYFEKTDQEPVVAAEKRGDAPCAPIYRKQDDTVLYRVSYRDCDINLEIFHALTDGTGAIEFLREIVMGYLKRAHGLAEEEETASLLSEQEEDSFFRYYSDEKQEKLSRKSRAAYQIRGSRIAQRDMRVMECVVSVKDLLGRAKASGVSITEYLTAALIWSVGRSMREEGWGKYSRKPVTIMVPVNLRKYYPSRSLSNFFGWMEIEYSFRGKESFEDVLAHIRRRFREDLEKGQVAARMNRYIGIEKNPFLKPVPLEVKDFFLKLGTMLGSRNVTAVFSNMGIVKLPARYEDYIDRFGAMASTDKLQMCACSFYDRFYFSVTSKYGYTQIPAYMAEHLREDGIPVEICRGREHLRAPERGKTVPGVLFSETENS